MKTADRGVTWPFAECKNEMKKRIMKGGGDCIESNEEGHIID
jgi:hypothetical protein